MPAEGVVISFIVALIFVILTMYIWTVRVNTEHIVFLMIRTIALSAALVALFALKLRIIGRVMEYLDLSKLYTVLYAIAYFLTMACFIVMFVYYAFICGIRLKNRRASTRCMPSSAAAATRWLRKNYPFFYEHKWLLPLLYVYRPIRGIFTRPIELVREAKSIAAYKSTKKDCRIIPDAYHIGCDMPISGAPYPRKSYIHLAFGFFL